MVSLGKARTDNSVGLTRGRGRKAETTGAAKDKTGSLTSYPVDAIPLELPTLDVHDDTPEAGKLHTSENAGKREGAWRATFKTRPATTGY